MKNWILKIYTSLFKKSSVTTTLALQNNEDEYEQWLGI